MKFSSSMPTYKAFKYFSNGNSEQWPGQVINLPVHLGVREKDAFYIVRQMESLQQFMQ